MAGLLAGLAGGLTAGEVRSLRVADHVSAPGERAGSFEVTYYLVNDSKKTITAWDFGCVIADQSGHAHQTRTGNDAYYALELPRRMGDPPPRRSGLIPPGGRISERVELEANELDGPFAAKSCGPVLAIFDDATFEGPEKLADSWFKSRAKDAVSAYRTKAEIQEELERGKGPDKALASVALRRHRPDTDPQGVDLGAQRVEEYLEIGKRRGAVDLQRLLAELDAYFLGAMAHLPSNWQSKVRAEVHP